MLSFFMSTKGNNYRNLFSLVRLLLTVAVPKGFSLRRRLLCGATYKKVYLWVIRTGAVHYKKVYLFVSGNTALPLPLGEVPRRGGEGPLSQKSKIFASSPKGRAKVTIVTL